MQVLVVGTGGREQAISWACRRHGHEVTLAAALPDDAGPETFDLVIPGPEAVLAAGIADECARRALRCFGPSAALARLETSKAFTRELTATLGIPGPASGSFDDAGTAIAWWRSFDAPVVVKLDGLAAGKGVIVPEGEQETLEAIEVLAAQGPIVLEERLSGPECSLLVLCDGTTARALPVAQDHKRIGEGDTGANTGGMGAYAPAPGVHDVDQLVATFVQPVLDHLRHRGTPYIGVLYAGLMLTSEGPRLLEFNCRFGDPETQAVLPLLESDLAEVALACIEGRLAEVELRVQPGSACTVVAAAPGYPTAPELGAPIEGLDVSGGLHPVQIGDAWLFPAGIRLDDAGRPTTSGGRVLAVTGLGDDLASARASAYAAMATVSFPGMQVRRDIGWKARGATITSYAQAGVDIDEGNRAVEQMRAAVERTHGPEVLRGLGSFGGSFDASSLRDLDQPVLVASTDGVGTKVELAARAGRVRGIGVDIVNHCIDDVLVQGARPLFFLDYLAASQLDADLVAEVVTGMADACAAAGCALLGGETAEMPGVYAPGAFDVAGTLVGVAERSALLPRDDVGPGDVLVGLASSGPHTNGYSLLRRLFEWLPLDSVPAGFDRTLGEALLEPHRSYLPVLDAALGSGQVKALAHITGGGLPENLPRVLPSGCDAEIRLGSWPVPPLFRLVREVATAFDSHELYRTLNMGIGMVVVCAPESVEEVRGLIDEPTWIIGELVAADGPGREVRLL